jgi:hypothetical protein
MISSQHPISVRWFLIVFLVLACPAFAANWKEKVLYSFQGGANDGAYPAGGVVFDKAGNLYGATTVWGPDSCFPIANECGLVFQLAPPAKKGGPWTETILYQFQGKTSNDASVPAGGVVLDAAGNVYGTTAYGGTGDCVLLGTSAGCGTVYELSPPAKKGDPWTETLLYSFKSGNDGYFPWGTLTFDSKGNLYGATQFGGGKGNTCNQFYGGNCGTVFELSPPKQNGGKWTEKVLHSFGGTPDGANPNGCLVLDTMGVIYGTTVFGGDGNGECGAIGCGTVFTLTPPGEKSGVWTEKMLHKFPGQDGAEAEAGLIFGKNGNLYGTAFAGGSHGYGSVFELIKPIGKSHTWTEKVLHLFVDSRNGGTNPKAGLILGVDGDLYGTAYYALSVSGNVFRLTPARRNGAWAFDVLYGFKGVPDGGQPAASLVFDKAGALFSTTQNGGTGTNCGFPGCGTVFEVRPVGGLGSLEEYLGPNR